LYLGGKRERALQERLGRTVVPGAGARVRQVAARPQELPHRFGRLGVLRDVEYGTPGLWIADMDEHGC
jgi:hypothetical protein